MISLTMVPMGTRTFMGFLMQSPLTVTERLIRGLPVFRYREINAALATFITMQPTSAGKPPAGTFRPVADSTIIFSAPCG